MTTTTGLSGSNILEGTDGSDKLNAGAGDDTLIYNVTANSGGTRDIYTGGSGIDTVLLELSREQWMDNQDQIASYKQFLIDVKKNNNGEVSNGSASDFTFTFGSSTLKVQMMEVLRVMVDINGDGNFVEQDLIDDLVTAVADTVVMEVGASTTDIDVLDNDIVPDLVRSLEFDTASEATLTTTYGTATLVQPDVSNASTWYFTYAVNADDPDYITLGAGIEATDSFDYKVADADNDSGTASVMITVAGVNDLAAIEDATRDGVQDDFTGSVTEAGSGDDVGTSTAMGLLLVTDPDEGESTFVVATDALSAKGYGTYSISASGEWTYVLSNTAVEAFQAGQIETDTFKVFSLDGTAEKTVTIQITGANDRATILDATPDGVQDDFKGSVTEAGSGDDVGTPTAMGRLLVTDPDAGESTFQVATGAPSAKGYGTYSISASGEWTYMLSNTAVEAFQAGQIETDEFFVFSLDGTATQTVTISIAGADDGPVLVAQEDTLLVTSNTAVTLSTAVLLKNDTGGDISQLKVTAVSTAQGGNGLPSAAGLTLNTNDTFSFDSGAIENFLGVYVTEYEFFYTVTNVDTNQTAQGRVLVWVEDIDGVRFYEGYDVGYLVAPNEVSDWYTLLEGGDGDDFIFGTANRDDLRGGAGDDIIYGYAGIDSLFGAEGNDSLFGGDGSDKLYGAAGDDNLDGGAGADTFILSNDGSVDTIFDFSIADGDKIVIFANGIEALSFEQEGDGMVFYDSETGKIFLEQNQIGLIGPSADRNLTETSFDLI